MLHFVYARSGQTATCPVPSPLHPRRSGESLDCSQAVAFRRGVGALDRAQRPAITRQVPASARDREPPSGMAPAHRAPAPAYPDRFGWRKGAKNPANTKPVENVTQTEGYEPIATPFRVAQAAVTQLMTFSLLRKSPETGDFVTLRPLGEPPSNTLRLTGENRPFPPT